MRPRECAYGCTAVLRLLEVLLSSDLQPIMVKPIAAARHARAANLRLKLDIDFPS
jgi:hypothetical protein